MVKALLLLKPVIEMFRPISSQIHLTELADLQKGFPNVILLFLPVYQLAIEHLFVARKVMAGACRFGDAL